MTKLNIEIILPTYNEEENVDAIYSALKTVLFYYNEKYNIIYKFIDNKSTDSTRSLIRNLIAKNNDIIAIFNKRNYGHIRSPYYALINSNADAVVLMASDFQDPPELIPLMINQWELSSKVIYGVKPKTEINSIFNFLRKIYYRALNYFSDVTLINDATGFGLYDKEVIHSLRKIGDPYPYLRGVIPSLGYSISEIPFKQPPRLRGVSKNNFYTLYDIAMLGFVKSGFKLLRLISLFAFVFIAFTVVFVFASLIDIFRSGLNLTNIYQALLMCMLSAIIFALAILSEYLIDISRVLNITNVVEVDEVVSNE